MALWMVEKFIGDQTGETLQNLLSGVLRKPSIERDTRPQNSLRSYPVGCQGSHPPILALYYEVSCGSSSRSHSQGGAQGSYPQEGTTAAGYLALQEELCPPQEPAEQGHWNQEEKPLLLTVSLQDPLLTKLKPTLAVKENCFSIIAKQVMKGQSGAKRQQNDKCHNELSRWVELELYPCSFQVRSPDFPVREPSSCKKLGLLIRQLSELVFTSLGAISFTKAHWLSIVIISCLPQGRLGHMGLLGLMI